MRNRRWRGGAQTPNLAVFNFAETSMTDASSLTMDGQTRPKESAAKDTAKSLRTRARILECATRLLVEIGNAAATNARVAEAAGLTRGAMLYHFPTREALIEAL